MNPPIISLQHWLGTAPGRYLLDWEQAQLDLAVANLFGFNALQLGLPELQALQANRMPHRWVALPEEALPWSLPTEGLFTGEGRHTVDLHPGEAPTQDAAAQGAVVHPAMQLPRASWPSLPPVAPEPLFRRRKLPPGRSNDPEIRQEGPARQSGSCRSAPCSA